MSNYGEFMKKRHEQDMKFFFGDYKMVSNKYFVFPHYIDDDNIVIATGNIKFVSGSPVLLIDNNKGVYLKDWQLKEIKNFDLRMNYWAVKLNRKYFKPYTFRFNFSDFVFSKEHTFDDLVEIAKEQDEENTEWSLGRF